MKSASPFHRYLSVSIKLNLIIEKETMDWPADNCVPPAVLISLNEINKIVIEKPKGSDLCPCTFFDFSNSLSGQRRQARKKHRLSFKQPPQVCGHQRMNAVFVLQRPLSQVTLKRASASVEETSELGGTRHACYDFVISLVLPGRKAAFGNAHARARLNIDERARVLAGCMPCHYMLLVHRGSRAPMDICLPFWPASRPEGKVLDGFVGLVCNWYGHPPRCFRDAWFQRWRWSRCFLSVPCCRPPFQKP